MMVKMRSIDTGSRQIADEVFGLTPSGTIVADFKTTEIDDELSAPSATSSGDGIGIRSSSVDDENGEVFDEVGDQERRAKQQEDTSTSSQSASVKDGEELIENHLDLLDVERMLVYKAPVRTMWRSFHNIYKIKRRGLTSLALTALCR